MSSPVALSKNPLQDFTHQLEGITRQLDKSELSPEEAHILISSIETEAKVTAASTKQIQSYGKALEIAKRKCISMLPRGNATRAASPSRHLNLGPQQAAHQHPSHGASRAASPFFDRAASPSKQGLSPASHCSAACPPEERDYDQEMGHFTQRLADIERAVQERRITIEIASHEMGSIQSQANISRKRASQISVHNYDNAASRLQAFLASESSKRLSDIDRSKRPPSPKPLDEEKDNSPRQPHDLLSDFTERFSDLTNLVTSGRISYDDATNRFDKIFASSSELLSNANLASRSDYTNSIILAQKAIAKLFQANHPNLSRRRPSRSVSPKRERAAPPPSNARGPKKSYSREAQLVDPKRHGRRGRDPVVQDIVPPDNLNIDDTSYYPLCRYLNWDEGAIMKYLSDMTDGANYLMRHQSNYVHPYELQRAYDGFTDFAQIGATRRERDREIKSEVFKLPSGVVTCKAKVENSSGICSSIFGELLLANKQEHPYEAYARFDGINGNKTALFAQENLQTYLEKELITMNPNGITFAGICNAFKATFFHLDQDAKSKISEEEGCSILVCLKISIGENEYLFTANAGDSRAVMRIGRKNLIQLSLDAIPAREIEGRNDPNPYNQSVLDRGGSIKNGKVQGKVPVTKGLNYSYLLEGSRYYPIDFIPDITCYPLPKGEEIILALVSRETWRRASSKDVITLLGCGDSGNIRNDAVRIMAATLITADEGSCDASILAVKLA